jgi:hypothetical protein
MAMLAADASSFYNVPLDVALEKIRSGLSGEAEPLRAFGVFLSDAAMKAKAAQMGLAGLNGELTEGQKITVRAALIQEQLGTANGDLEAHHRRDGQPAAEADGRPDQRHQRIRHGNHARLEWRLMAASTHCKGSTAWLASSARGRDLVGDRNRRVAVCRGHRLPQLGTCLFRSSRSRSAST